MERIADSVLSKLLDLWYGASPADFGAVVLSVIVCGWFVGRYFRE